VEKFRVKYEIALYSASENEVDLRQNNSSASVITNSSAEEQETYYHFPYGGIVYRSGSDPNN
jgi:hypothetical protein